MSDNALKAAVEGYAPKPFFFAQTGRRDGAIRWVAWTGDLAQLKRLVYAVLRCFSPNAQVLLKVDKQNVADGTVWTRYHGDAPLAKVIRAIESHERFVFQDGYTQLCVRDDDTGEYVALDEYDVLYIYSDDDRFAHACRECRFEEREEELISDRGHWRRSLPDTADACKSFVKALHLKQVE
jgi:hypothetical protein